MEQLALEKQHLEETVKSLRARCSDMEEQCVQHGRMHQRMKGRYADTQNNKHTTTQSADSTSYTFLRIFRGIFWQCLYDLLANKHLIYAIMIC